MPQADFHKELSSAANALRKGGVILYPTDTIWGIGCDATQESAVEKIYRIKQREPGKSLIVLVSDEAMLNRYVRQIPDAAWDLIQYSGHPLTIVYPEAAGLAQNVPADDFSVGIRVTRDPFCRELIRRCGKPIVSTSANLSGKPFPRSFSEIDPAVLNGVDYAVNLRREEISISPPSTVIKLGIKGEIQILRKA